ncbi:MULTISPECIES: hypothetical protein [unclassified Streptomyces]|uniref:hypothetical protein n=1 Tax=unclassified Streptomyces TaxID=2593676 RepID=UPI00225145B5|nr:MULTISPECIES: hypothetical protein [unclassified Streptomyces]MCX4829761.1 hypothetical protein [Streptomyces sp. NBC_01016]
MTTNSEAWQRHRARRSFAYRRGTGWIVGAVLVVFAVKILVSAGSWVGWQVTPQGGDGAPGVFKFSACAPAGDDYRCTGAFREDGGAQRIFDDAVLVTHFEQFKGGLAPVYRMPDGGYSYDNPGEVTTGMLGGAAMVFGAAALMVGIGIFFLATGYTPRPPRLAGWSRWGRVSFGEAWQVVRSRAPLLWSIVGFCVLGLVLLVTGPLVVSLA